MLGVFCSSGVAQVFENNGTTSEYDNDGGWFGWSQYNVTASWTVIVDARPSETQHYLVTLWEDDVDWDDELGRKIACIEPAQWVERGDGRFQVTIQKTWNRISTYYGDDWISTIESVSERRALAGVCEGPSCGAISTTFEQWTEFDPLEQVIRLEESACTIVEFRYGEHHSDFREDPILPGESRLVRYDPQGGLQPFEITFEGGRVEAGTLIGMVDPDALAADAPPGGAVIHVSMTPHPFAAGNARFRLSLPEAAVVSLRIHGVDGRLVRTLLRDESLDAGLHPIGWDGRDDSGRRVASGVYQYVLDTPAGIRSDGLVVTH